MIVATNLGYLSPAWAKEAGCRQHTYINSCHKKKTMEDYSPTHPTWSQTTKTFRRRLYNWM